LALKRNEELL